MSEYNHALQVSGLYYHTKLKKIVNVWLQVNVNDFLAKSQKQDCSPPPPPFPPPWIVK